MKYLFTLIFALNFISMAAEKPNVIIIFTDDHGYADLGCQGVFDDVKTPNIDAMAEGGVRCTSGYATAPQCCPSRAGIVSGQYQQRFELEGNGDGGLPWSVNTIPERMQKAGYVTGMAGKWHLSGNGLIASNGEFAPGHEEEAKKLAIRIKKVAPKSKKSKNLGMGRNSAKNYGNVFNHGFMEYMSGPMSKYLATHDSKGKALKNPPTAYMNSDFRLDVQTNWSVNFIERNVKKKTPFFLYLAYFAPHVPLEATEKYMKRFPGDMPERRRKALAMISAMDDGVGRIRKKLKSLGELENTIIFFISDNGAPLKIKKEDKAGGGPGWDGSLNDPMNGEKGMLSEGGVRVPYIVSWPSKIPGGQVFHRPVISLDAGYTAVKLSGSQDLEKLDGVDLLPFLKDNKKGDPHEALFFRWGGQVAVRFGDWKLLTYGKDKHRFLFDLSKDQSEQTNLYKSHPEKAKSLHKIVNAWTDSLPKKGSNGKSSQQGVKYFEYYLPK